MLSHIYISLHVRCQLFFSDCNQTEFTQTLIFCTDFREKKTIKYQTAWKSIHWDPSCSMRTNGQTDMTKLRVSFRDFAKAPKKKMGDGNKRERWGNTGCHNVTWLMGYHAPNSSHNSAGRPPCSDTFTLSLHVTRTAVNSHTAAWLATRTLGSSCSIQETEEADGSCNHSNITKVTNLLLEFHLRPRWCGYNFCAVSNSNPIRVVYVDLTMAKAIDRRLRFYCASPGSIPGQCMWDLWWTPWHWYRFLSAYFDFALPIPSLQCSMVIFIYILLLSEGQTGEAWEPTVLSEIGEQWTEEKYVHLTCWYELCLRQKLLHCDQDTTWLRPMSILRYGIDETLRDNQHPDDELNLRICPI
jgi:hypothetical protein